MSRQVTQVRAGRVIRMGNALVLSLGLSFATAAVAVAGTPFTQSCVTSGYACAYWHAGYNNLMNVIRAGSGLVNIPVNQNDSMSSWINNSSKKGGWAQHSNGRGACHTMNSYRYGTYRWLDGTNDTMSSWWLNGKC